MSDAAIDLPALRILVVDADRAFHAIVQKAAVALPGTEVVCCTTPGEALNRMNGFEPVVILVEGRLNGAAGINFVRRVRAGQSPVPAGTLVIFASQDFSGGLSGKLCDVGCHAIIRKPVSVEALARAMVRTLQNPIPFVMGGKYLGPDRRAPGPSAKRDPERRRTPTRGGWTSTPRLTGGKIALVSVAKPVPASGGTVEPAAAPKPSARIETADAAEPNPGKARPEPVEAELRRAPQRDDAPLEVAAPAAKSDAAAPPGFDVGAVVELHRQWMASNGAAGARANLAGQSLSGASLGGQNLAKADLRGADLANADLRRCILVDADLRNACLAQALLDEAQLAGAKIRHADMQFARLTQSGLQGSDLAGADLRGAVLAGADLAGANLLGADLRGADVTAINLTQRQLDRASGDHTTRLPPGLFVARAGDGVGE